MKLSTRFAEQCNVLTALILTLFTIAPVVVSNATIAKPADGSFKRHSEAKIQPSSNRPVNAI